MGNDYIHCLGRLREERLGLHYSQSEMGCIMRMSQSHYSKAEQGIRRFTYYEIQCLCESCVDTYYIFTGKRVKYSYKDFFMNYSYEELVCILKIICLVIEYYYVNNKSCQWKKLYEEIRYMKTVIMQGRENGSILYNIRWMLGLSQQKMSEIIEVDIKKLRELENGRRMPDSEILWRIYHLYSIPIALMVKSKSEMVNAISYLLGEVDEDARYRLLDYLEEVHSLS